MRRAVNGPTRSRTLTRSRTSDISILNNLTTRDTDICLDIYEHRFLTTVQLFQLHFGSYARARTRTHDLYEYGVLDRFRPPKRPGSLPWHYVLGSLGGKVVSGLLDIKDASVYFERNRPYRLAKSPRLTHMREINDFFCRLVFAGRQQESGFRVTRWWGEHKSASHCRSVVRPDATGALDGESWALDFFLEMDRGTEWSRQLRDKVIDYEEASVSRHLPRVVLFCFPNERRERFARGALESARITIATGLLGSHLEDPLGRNWLPVRNGRRLSLSELRPSEAST
jgi:hypothetical protein